MEQMFAILKNLCYNQKKYILVSVIENEEVRYGTAF